MALKTFAAISIGSAVTDMKIFEFNGGFPGETLHSPEE